MTTILPAGIMAVQPFRSQNARRRADRPVDAPRVLKKAQLAQHHTDKFSSSGTVPREFVEASIWLRVLRRSE
jgi:hypothetical protein